MNKPTFIYIHKTLNQISGRVQLQTIDYSRHFTRGSRMVIFVKLDLLVLGMCRGCVDRTIRICFVLFLNLLFNCSRRRFVILGLRFTFLLAIGNTRMENDFHYIYIYGRQT